MKHFKRALSMLCALCIVALSITQSSFAAFFSTTPTGYQKASDVVYRTVSGYRVNWGARQETATFLTTYAQNFYTGNYTIENLITKQGGSSQSNAPSSALYSTLQTLMKSKQTKQTSYADNKDLMKYTDCVANDYSKISTFYSGKLVNSSWDGGKTWNREHTWPNSKGDQAGNGENDIMMLRPEDANTNSSRGNKAYGESSSYYDPNKYGASMHGDCARILLYTYTRWGCTDKMWGSSGVIENLDILLKWIEEDPVDTWEIARNDAVQSITGTRNVFVDYPELAFMLFGKSVPKNMTTPSGLAKTLGSTTTPPTSTPTTPPSSTPSYDDDREDPPLPPSSPTTSNPTTSKPVVNNSCKHTKTEVHGKVLSSCQKTGFSGDIICALCGVTLSEGQSTPKTAHISNDGDTNCDVCGSKMDCIHTNTKILSDFEVNCQEDGYTGDEVCEDCGAILKNGEVVVSTGEHNYGEWTIIRPAANGKSGLKTKTCSGCGDSIAETIQPAVQDAGGLTTTQIVLICIVSLVVIAGAAAAIIFFTKKKKSE